MGTDVPDVSTIIPVHNAAAYVRPALDSVLAQRNVATELIVVDDGSTDDTLRVLGEYGDRIRVVSQANAGPARARNHGVGLARGDWVAFLDSDDQWRPDKLEKQLQLADEKTGFIYTNRSNFGELGRVSGTQSDSVKQWEGDVLEPLLLTNFITTSSVLMRKSWFDRLGGFDESLGVCEDWDLWLRFAAEGGWVRLCREPLTGYCWREGSLSGNQVRNCTARLTIVRRALDWPRVRQLSHKVRKQAIANAWSCSAWHAAPSEPAKAVNWYIRSAYHWPWDLEVYKGIVKSCLGLLRGGRAKETSL